MASQHSVSAVAGAMLCMAVVGNMLRGGPEPQAAVPATSPKASVGQPATPRPAPPVAVPTVAAAPVEAVASATVPPPPAAVEAAMEPPAAIDDLPTGSIDPSSGLRVPNPAAYAEAAKAGPGLVLTGAEAVNYLAGNTLRRESPGEPLHFTYFGSRGIAADGTERTFVAHAWDRDRTDLCEAGRDGTPVCRSLTILLDAKEELQGGRLGTVTIGGSETAELVKGNILHIPPHIPFLDSTIDVASTAPAPAAAPQALADRTVVVTGEGGGARHFVYYAPDNRLYDVQPVEAGANGGRAVSVVVGHWHLAKSELCEAHAAAKDACFKTEPAPGGGLRLVPALKGGQALRAVVLPEERIRTVAED